MISVIIPAHNEANVIGRTLEPLVDAVVTGEMEVIVVCNGCTDNTVEIVAGFPGVKCLETERPSKSNALNLGDLQASGFPRFYLDADIVLSVEAIRRIAAVLDTGPFLAASSKMQMNFRNASWAVKAFYEIWSELPYCQAGMIGTGVYALSRAGRERFFQFPDIIADDRYIRALFTEHERTAVVGAFSMVMAPSTLWDLLKIKTRSRLGGYEFAARFPELLTNEVKNYSQVANRAVVDVKRWPKYTVYLAINLLARFRALRQYRNRKFDLWERDESSRSLHG